MVAGQVFEHHLAIVELVKRLALQRAGGDGGLCLPFEGCSHKTGSVVSARNDPGTSDLLLRWNPIARTVPVTGRLYGGFTKWQDYNVFAPNRGGVRRGPISST